MTAICPVPYAPVRIIDICSLCSSFPEVKPAAVVNKNGVKAEAAIASGGGGAASGFSGTKIFTWFMVLALLGVWSSVAVVWLELVDYDNVIGESPDLPSFL